MVTLKKQPWNFLVGVVYILLTFQSPGFTQESLSTQDLPHIEPQASTIPEWVDLPSIATPTPHRETVFLVRSTNIRRTASKTQVLGDIYFDAKRYFLKRDAAHIIEESASLLHKEKRRKIHIEAYCDTRGSMAYGHALGTQRAYDVFRYFQHLGISSSQIAMVSFGSHPPHCHVRSTACWQETRRIKHAFQLLAMHQPQSGCIIRLRLEREAEHHLALKPTTFQPFLQRIHLAETR